MHRSITYALCIGVGLGVILGVLTGSVSFFISLVVVSGTVVYSLTSRARYTTLCFILAVALLLGVVRVSWYEHVRGQESVSKFDHEVVEVVGEVRAEPDARERAVRVTLDVKEINHELARGTLLAVLPAQTVLEYGDTVVVAGQVSEAKSFLTDSGREFDYPHYLEAHGIDRLLERATLSERVVGDASLTRTLLRAKKSFEAALERMLPEPHGALLEGVLLGEKRALPSEVQEAFINSSLIHVVVLSGYNISIVSEATLRALSFLPAAFSLPLSGVMIILFAMVTGAGAATVRACVMGVIALVARYFHRSSDALVALAVASVGMVLWSPLTSVYDPGFTLSVLATFGLITLSPWVEQKLSCIKIFRAKRLTSLRSIAASTIAVQIFILPMLLYYTGVLSVVALPANLLVLPMIPLTMLMGFITGVLALLHPLLAFIPSVITQLLLSFVLFVATASSSLPLAYFTLSTFPLWLTLLAYIPLTWFAIQKHKNTLPHKG